MRTRFVLTGERLILVAATVAILAPPANLWAGTKGISGIDIIVKRQPTGSAISVQIGAGGSVRFQIPEGGNYTIQASRKIESSDLPGLCPEGSVRIGPAPGTCFPLDGVNLTGNFSAIGRAPAGPLVTGNRYIDGNTLRAAGSVRGNGEPIFSVDFAVTAPAAFVGTLTTADTVGIDVRHFSFYSVAGGPPAPAQTVTISNASAATVSYKAAFEVAGGTHWAVNLSKSAGSIGAGQTDSIDVSPQPGPAGFPEGAYNGFLRIREQTPDGAQENVAAVTLFVQPPAAAKGTLLVDRPMQAVYPLADGSYEPAVFTFTNNSATQKAYGMRVPDGVTIQPASLILPPGGRGTVTVQALKNVRGLVAWREDCIITYAHDADGFPNVPPEETTTCTWAIDPFALGTICTPTKLQPVITGIKQPVARAGYPLDVTVQVFDNCGGQLTDFTAIMSVNDGGKESHIAAVQSSGGVANKAIGSKGGQASFLLPGRMVFAASGHAAAAGDAPELLLNGYLYPYFTIGAAGLTLKIDAEATNPGGGDPLTGSVGMPLPFDSGSNSPMVAQGAMVPNTDFEPRPIAPFEVFSLFTVLPGAEVLVADRLPFPPSLGDTQVLIDGIANVPLIRTANGQVQGILPDLAEGTHIINVLYKNAMSGAVTFGAAAAAPSPLRIDDGTTHLYDPAGKLVTQQNPVRAGEIYVAYTNGMGRMKGIDQIAGSPTPVVAMEPEQPCKLTIGDNTPELVYCGASPGSPALDQVNFRMAQIDAPNANAGDVVAMSIVLDQGDYKGSVSAMGWFQVGPQAMQTKPLNYTTNPAGLSYTVNGVAHTAPFGPAFYNLGSSVTVDVPQPLQNGGSGTQYRFFTWSSPLTPKTALVPFTVVSSLPSLLIANFDPEYMLTGIGNLSTSLPPLTGGYYKHGTKVTVTGSCPAGSTVFGLLILTESFSTTVPSPWVITMNAPTTVTVQCSPPPITSKCLSPVPSGMTGWWPLDEPKGAKFAKNIGSLAADGTYNGPTVVPAGKVAGAYDFSSGSVALTGNTTAYDFQTNPTFSIDAWVSGNDLGSAGVHNIVSKHTLSSAGSQGYSLNLNRGLLSLHLHGSSSKQDFVEPSAYSHAKVYDGSWHLVAATVDFAANQGYLYFDGVPVLSFVPSPNGSFSNSFPLTIGAPTGAVPFPGQIDEVEIFDRAITLAELQAIYSAGSGKCKAATFKATISGCNATVASPNGAGPNYPANSTMLVTPIIPTGGLGNVTVTMNGVTTTYTKMPAIFTLTGDATIVVDCVSKPVACLDVPSKLPGLQGWYALDEATTATTFADYGASPAAPLTKVGTASQSTTGKVSKAWQFVGTAGTDILQTTGSPAKYQFGTSDFSIDAWVSLTGNTTTPFLRKMTAGAKPIGYTLSFDANRLRLDLGGGGAPQTWIGAPFAGSATLKQIVVSVSRANGVLFYVDGQLDPFSQTGTMPAGSLANNLPLLVGGDRQMVLDEVEIFNRALTASQAQLLYLADSRGKCKPTTINTLSFDVSLAGQCATLTGSNPPTGKNRYPGGTDLTVTVAGLPVNFTVTMGGVTTAYTSSPITFTLTDNASIDIVCGSPCPAGSVAPPSGMTAWWGFEPETSLTVQDLTGRGNTGTITGRGSGSNRVGAAFDVNGSSSYMGVPSSSDLNFGLDSFSMDMWVKWPDNTSPASTNDNPFLVAKYIQPPFGNTYQGYIFALAPGYSSGKWTSGLGLQMYDVPGTNAPAYLWYTGVGGNQYVNVFPADGNWHLVGVTYTQTIPGSRTTPVVQFYVDGLPVATQPNGVAQSFPAPDPTTSAGLYLGKDPYSSNNKFVGQLDEVEIFKRALTPGEMLGIFNAGAAGKCRTGAFPVTVDTNPANIGATVGLTPSTPGTALNAYTTSLAAGSYQATANPATITNGGTQYRLKNWSLNGALNAAWTASPTPAQSLAAAATFTANYDTYYQVIMTLTGCTSQNTAGIPPGGGSVFLPAGSSFNASIAPGAGQSITGATLNGSALQTGTNGTVAVTVNPVNGPVTVTAACGQPPIVKPTYANQSVGGNIIVAMTNTSPTTATNLRITSITNVTADAPNAIVFDQAVVGVPNFTFPLVFGDLGTTSTSRNLGFRATSGSVDVPFSFTVNYQADNLASQSTVINVPFPR